MDSAHIPRGLAKCALEIGDFSASCRSPPDFSCPPFSSSSSSGRWSSAPSSITASASSHPIPFHRAMDRTLLISAVAALGLAWSRLPLSQNFGRSIAMPGNNSCSATLWPPSPIPGHYRFHYLAFSGFTSAHLTFRSRRSEAACSLRWLPPSLFRPWRRLSSEDFFRRELVERLGWLAGWIIAASIYMRSCISSRPHQISIISQSTSGAASPDFTRRLPRDPRRIPCAERVLIYSSWV